MNAQFHTPSFGDEIEIDTSPQSKRMRSMDQSFDEYHSANDESFNSLTSASVNSLNHNNNAVTAASARQQQSPAVPDATAVIAEPKKPLSAYALFFRDTVSAIKQQNPTCSFQELSRIVASMWEALDPTHKNVYQKKHEMARNDCINQMRIYRQQIEQQQQLLQEQQQQQLSANDSSNNTSLQTKPAVFTITRFNADNNIAVGSAGGTLNNINANTTTAQQQHEQVIVNNLQQPPMKSTENNNLINNNSNATSNTTQSPAAPQQIEMLTEAGSAQKCTRENCTKRAIINPDWEDEYCSNECVVIHCRTVFNDWVKANIDARKQ